MGWSGKGFFASTLDRFGLDLLELEVCDGKAILIVNESGQVERITSVTVLRLLNTNGYKMFAQLGKVVQQRAVPLCQLPGVKWEEGEGPAHSLERLMHRRLGFARDSIRIEDQTEQVTLGKSPKFGIRTRYMRTIYTVALEDTWRPPENFVLKSGVHVDVERPLDIDIFIVRWEDEECRLFAWLTPTEFDEFSVESSEGEQALAAL